MSMNHVISIELQHPASTVVSGLRDKHTLEKGSGLFDRLDEAGILGIVAVLSVSRVENWRGGGRYRGLTVAGGFRRVPVSQSDP